MYPAEKTLGLLYERFDMKEDQVIDFDEFV